jgi:hypothetical protein
LETELPRRLYLNWVKTNPEMVFNSQVAHNSQAFPRC